MRKREKKLEINSKNKMHKSEPLNSYELSSVISDEVSVFNTTDPTRLGKHGIHYIHS